MYLTYDFLGFMFFLLWCMVGWKVLKAVPLVCDPMVAFSRYHPRLAPLMVIALIVFWPINKLVWRFAYYLLTELENLKKKL